MKKILLVICGPTATGKTSLGFFLAKKFNGEIVSADSRQVYKYMDVITGKDLPATSNFQYPIPNLKKEGIGCYEIDGVRVWGYDLVRPDQEFSVSHFRKITVEIIKDIYKRKKLPILVGGTGLYIDSIIKPLAKMDIPKNNFLRKELSNIGVNELYRRLLRTSPNIALSMNPSDRSNPRRLIRAIEIAESDDLVAGDNLSTKKAVINFDSILWIGLKAKSQSKLNIFIDARIEKRIGRGLDNEFEYLRKKDYLRFVPSRTIGYKQWLGYLKGEYNKNFAIEKWKIAEHQYAKRQMTWFKRNQEIRWFYIEQKSYNENIEKVVEKWYSSRKNE